MRSKSLKKKLDMIFNYYTQNEVAMILGITQWKLLEKMQKNDFSEVEIMDIEHILNRDIKEKNFYSKNDMIDKTKTMTAVEWLATYLKGITSLNCDEVIEQAKAREQNQIMNAWATGVISENNMTADQYYNETYGSDEHILYNDSKRQWVIEGMKLYRKHLKQKI